MTAGDPRSSRWRRARCTTGRVMGTLPGIVGVVLTVGIVLVAVFADTLAPHDPFATVGPALRAPSGQFPMGTDDLGRDVLSGVLIGARASLFIGLGVAMLVAIIGVGIGIVSGYVGGTVDDLLMRTTEAVQVIPRFFLAIVVIALVGPGTDRLIVVLGLTSWSMVARVVRSETLPMRDLAFVEAARALGASTPTILWRHVLPAVLPATITCITLMVGQAILIEASLGFLGLGDPSVMSWGVLAGNAQPFIRAGWWLAVFPGGGIAVAVLGISLLGDGAAQALHGRDPRGTRRRSGRTAVTRPHAVADTTPTPAPAPAPL